ncbi:Citrate transporter [Agrilactobacillus composti DSM 18527 = JCM 14202]|uniref:Citrate transporter n=2 Tax=Agrilactobacillus TaxID=2767875 RepID=A0A0R1XKP3_9LACO|nr:Citrate transporter [Agrilactobacillus composti DSM 18527 = JCM 14202]
MVITIKYAQKITLIKVDVNMSYLAIVGFVMMIVIVVLLLKQKVSTIFCFSVVPVIAAILIGSSVKQIGTYLTKGLAMTTPVSLIMLFSLPYFMLMADAGLFNGIVRRILKHININPSVLAVLTVIVAMITGLDVSITSVFLITVPLLLPFYKKMKMNPVILVFLTTLGIINTYDVPWSARMLRSASLIPNIPNGPMYLFKKLLPAQIVFTILILALAAFIGYRESRRINAADGDGVKHKSEKIDVNDICDDPELGRPKLFWINVVLTLLVISVLCFMPAIPSYFTFAFGLVIALSVNYKDLKLQNKLLKKYASSLFPVMPAILLSGVVVGVMQYSGMMKAMVDTLLMIIPKSFGPFVYIIVAVFSTPLMFLFTNDTWYFVLMPIIGTLMKAYGIPMDIVILTLFMNMGAMLTPIAQPQIYIGTDLTNGAVNLQKYVKFSFTPIWILSIVWTIIGLAMGIFR